MVTFLSDTEFTQLASDEQIAKTMQALSAHGIRAVVFETGEEARSYVLDLIPAGAEVYNLPSRTLELIGLTEDIAHPTHFQSVRARLLALDRVTQRVYGQTSAINKLLIVNGEAYPGRITVVLVEQNLGF